MGRSVFVRRNAALARANSLVAPAAWAFNAIAPVVAVSGCRGGCMLLLDNSFEPGRVGRRRRNLLEPHLRVDSHASRHRADRTLSWVDTLARARASRGASLGNVT